MKKAALLSILFLTAACSDNRPEVRCPGAGDFVMTLKNEEGRILPDKRTGKYYLHFSPDGRMEYNTTAYPCNLSRDFQGEVNVYFDGDFYEAGTDSTADFIVYVRNMDYR
ncbi:MAG: hypothetical protein LRY55_16215 [Leadbetterella sp.]|nr:hypothetical protein [Leadbetterella sp.]